MGAGAGEARREERAEAGAGGSGKEDRGADAPALGDRRGLRARGLQTEAPGSVTSATEYRGRPKTSEVQGRSSAPERETTNRPVRGTASLRLGIEARREVGSPQTVRTPMCTGPQNAAHE